MSGRPVATEALFCGEGFARLVRYQMYARNVRQHEVCAQTGISRPTLCRILTGKDPSIESYLRLKRWISTPRAISLGSGEDAA